MATRQEVIKYFTDMKPEKLVETILAAFQQLDQDLKEKKRLKKGK